MLDQPARSREPEKIWQPDPKTIADANISQAIARLGLTSYEQLYAWSIRDPEAFWGDVIETLDIRFERAPSRVLDTSGGVRNVRWLPGATMNIAASCFQADDNDPAILSGDPDGVLTTVSYGELRKTANRVASGLRNLGLSPGDGVAIFMPMTPCAVAIYLGIVSAGCGVVSIADSFAPEQVRARLEIGAAEVMFTTAYYQRGGKQLPVYQRACEAHAPRTIVVDVPTEAPRLREGDLTWNQFLDGASDADTTVGRAPDATVNILFSSGTTGTPKAIPWDHTTPIKAASDAYFHHDLHPGEVVVWPTNLGWMMGPWLVFATLINRGTIALFEGSPTGASFGRFVEAARVTVLGVVPSLVRKWRGSAAMERCDWSALRLFSSTGECSNAEDMAYLSRLAGGKPIIEYCGGTEIGGGYLTSTVVQPNYASVFTTPALGSAIAIVDEQNQPADRGEVMLTPPCMGLSQRLIQGDHDDIYYGSVPLGLHGQIRRRHGDLVERSSYGYRVLGRMDDTMNLGGIKVAAAEIERVLTDAFPWTDVAAIAVTPHDGGPNELVICLADASGAFDRGQRHVDMQNVIRRGLNPLFKIQRVVCLPELPRTSSNKILRRELRRLCTDTERTSPSLL